MNKHIHIRDFDGASHGKLAERARLQGMSLSEYLRRELAKLANRSTMEEIAEPKISSEDIVRFLHEGREEREKQILNAVSESRRNRA
jgi:hypothetical protein